MEITHASYDGFTLHCPDEAQPEQIRAALSALTLTISDNALPACTCALGRCDGQSALLCWMRWCEQQDTVLPDEIGVEWGKLLAWITLGAPTEDEGVAAARSLVRWRIGKGWA